MTADEDGLEPLEPAARGFARALVTASLQAGAMAAADLRPVTAHPDFAAEVIAELVEVCTRTLTAMAGSQDTQRRQNALEGTAGLDDLLVSRVAAQALWGRYLAAVAAVE